MQRRAVAARSAAKSGSRELGAAGQRGALGLGAPDDPLLLAQRRPVPGLDDHPDPAHDDVRAAGEPAGRRRRPAGPRRAAPASAVSSALTFAVPSLKPIRLRGVTWAVEVDEVRPKPSCDQRTRAVPNAARVRLRTACIATCGSSAHAWTRRSPSERAGSRLSPGKWGRRDEARRAAGRRGRTGRPALPSRPDEQRPPEPDGDREPGRRQVRAPRRCRPAARRTAPVAGPNGPAGEARP